MSVSPPYTEGSRGWGLGRSWRVGFKLQPILLRRASSFLTVMLLLSLLKIKTNNNQNKSGGLGLDSQALATQQSLS